MSISLVSRRPRTPSFCGLCFAVVLAASAASAQDQTAPAATTKLRPQTPRVDAISPLDPEALEQSIRKGVEFLVNDQNPNGSWGSATRTKQLNIYAHIPGSHLSYRTATSALCVSGLIEVGEEARQAIPGGDEALKKGEAYLLKMLPEVRRDEIDVLYNVWSHGYGIQALVRMYHRHEGEAELQKQIMEAIEGQIALLARYDSVDGGWGYYDFNNVVQTPSASSTSFVNGTILVALAEARDLGAKFTPVADDMVSRAIAATNRMRKPDNTYLYGEYLKMMPMRGINVPGGSLGRSQCCNIALRMWGDETVDNEVLDTWLHRLFARNGWLDIGRKRPVPHEAWFQVAGYFYYFGHYYGALCIEAMPAAEQSLFKDHMAATLLPLQETDGSWWDYPLYDYHQPYGTGLALQTLVRCRPDWKSVLKPAEQTAEQTAD